MEIKGLSRKNDVEEKKKFPILKTTLTHAYNTLILVFIKMRLYLILYIEFSNI